MEMTTVSVMVIVKTMILWFYDAEFDQEEEEILVRHHVAMFDELRIPAARHSTRLYIFQFTLRDVQPLLRAFWGIHLSKAGCADSIKQESRNEKKLLPDYTIFVPHKVGPLFGYKWTYNPYTVIIL